MQEQKVFVLTAMSNGFVVHVTSPQGPEQIIIQDDGSVAFRSLKDAFDRAKRAEKVHDEPCDDGPRQHTPNGERFDPSPMSAQELLQDPHVQQTIGKTIDWLTGASKYIGNSRDRKGGAS